MRTSTFMLLAASCCACSVAAPAPSASIDVWPVVVIPPSDACTFARDGECDEPVNCALGTDSTDCVQACADGRAPHLLGAACAFRASPPPPMPPPPGSGGTLHLTGHRDGTIDVPSGADATKTVSRHYRLFVPAAYRADRPTPLVVMLPGNRADIYGLADYTQLEPSAELNRFIVVYAEQEFRAASSAWSWWTDWDWVGRPSQNPDLAFLRLLVGRIKAEYQIDPSRIFAVGHSRGAAMALIAAFELPDVFAGAGAQSGFTEFGYERRIKAWTGRRVPVVLVHGVQDQDVCIDCTAGGSCASVPGRVCGNVEGSDSLGRILVGKGWTSNELNYHRLENVAHRWQPQLNQQVVDFLFARPRP